MPWLLRGGEGLAGVAMRLPLPQAGERMTDRKDCGVCEGTGSFTWGRSPAIACPYCKPVCPNHASAPGGQREPCDPAMGCNLGGGVRVRQQHYVGRDGGLCHTCDKPHHGVRYDVEPDLWCESCGIRCHSDAMALATDLGQRGEGLGGPCPRCGDALVSDAVRLAERLNRKALADRLRTASNQEVADG